MSAGRVRDEYRYSRTVLRRAFGGSPLLMWLQQKMQTHIRRENFSSYAAPLHFEISVQHRGCTRSVRHKTSNQMSRKGSIRPPPHRLRPNKTNKRDAKAATQIFHRHAGKPREGCGLAPAYFTVSTAFDPARSAQKHFVLCLRRTACKQTGKHWCSSPPIGMEPGPTGVRFDGPERPDGMTV